MKKQTLLLALVASIACSARNLKSDVDLSHDLWWNAPEAPMINLTLTDTLGADVNSTIEFYVTPDIDASSRIMSVKMPVINNEATANLSFEMPMLAPGFYKCHLLDDGIEIKTFNIGYEPTNIVSLPDSPADFDEFWQRAIAELAAVPGEYVVAENQQASGKLRKAYDVSMRSLGGETIRGRLYVPVKKGKYPALIYYNGYGGKIWDMDVDGRSDIIEFVTGVRGQMFNEPYNTYGDWIRYNLGEPESYYYRGAYMDTLRFLDFIEQHPSVDTSRIYAEGGSQGGALTLVAAALAPSRFKGIAPYIPFMSDFPDYFKIVEWPMSAIMEAAREKGLSEQQALDCMRYFDVKNFARKISCPVMMGIGLQDPTCPPHTNMSSYNLITSPKELIIYPTCGHTVDYSDWNPRRDKFISD